MESSNANGAPVIVFTQPMPGAAPGAPHLSHLHIAQRKNLAKKLTILGSLQIVFGSLLILFQIVSVILVSTYYPAGVFTFIGYGIWNGIFFVITGAFGCVAGIRTSRGYMITFNVMSIISASLNMILVTLAACSILIIGLYERNRHYYSVDPESLIKEDERVEHVERASLAMESLMLIVALAETIVAIWSSVVCCKMGACCCDCGDACCCQPVPAPTQGFWMQQPPIDGTQLQQQQQNQAMLVYSAGPTNPPPIIDVFQGNKRQKQFKYQQLMSDPNTFADGEFGDQTRLCILIAT